MMYDKILKTIFPATTCVVCGGLSLKDYPGLCEDCRNKLLSLRESVKFCSRCGIFYPQKYFQCPSCFGKRARFTKEGVYAGVPYDKISRPMVWSVKYNNRRDIAETMVKLFLWCNDDLFEEDFSVVTGVPLHPGRLKERGYNQSRILGECIAAELHLPYADIVKRVRDTPSQTTLSLAERLNNPKGAFSVIDGAPIQNKRILLVDDVLTTGATLSECRRVLKQGGAKSVTFAVFAAALYRE